MSKANMTRLMLFGGFASCVILLAAVPLPQPSPRLNVAVQALNNHHPRVAVQVNTQTSTVWAFVEGGVAQRRFDRTNGWSAWQLFGLPPDAVTPADPKKLGPSIPMTTGLAGVGSTVAGVFAYPSKTGQQIAVLVADALSPVPTQFSLQTAAIPSSLGVNDIRPETVVADDINNLGFSAYATVSPDKGRSFPAPNPLLEIQVRWPATARGVPPANQIQVTMTNHGRPTVGTRQVDVVLGPNSAVGIPIRLGGSSSTQLHKFVFVKTSAGDNDHLTYRHIDGNNRASWGIDLGTPTGSDGIIVDGPVAYAYSTPNGHNMSVFVVAFDRQQNRFQLYERHWVWTDGSPSVDDSWLPDWRVHGSPIDFQRGGPLLRSDTKFRLTAYSIWVLENALRINMFGWADRDAGQPKRLVEHVWDGGRWSWGNVHDPVPNNLNVEADSSAVIDTPNFKRFFVLGRTADGAIFEHFYLIENGQWSGWFWRDLS